MSNWYVLESIQKNRFSYRAYRRRSPFSIQLSLLSWELQARQVVATFII